MKIVNYFRKTLHLRCFWLGSEYKPFILCSVHKLQIALEILDKHLMEFVNYFRKTLQLKCFWLGSEYTFHSLLST